MLGKFVVVRAEKAGVFVGILKEKNGSEVTLTDARKLWYWDGACGVEQLAVDGTTKPKNCKFTKTVSEICILGAIQILPCSMEAEISIRGVFEWKN